MSRRRGGVVIPLLVCLTLLSFISCRDMSGGLRIKRPVTPPLEAISGIWIRVDTRKDNLTVMRDGSVVRVFDNIAIGSSGAREKTRRGDAVTPLGTFRIGWVNHYSKFNYFYGITYPNLTYATKGLSRGLITKSEFDQIARAERLGTVPPQNTNLGGHIGIHGVGRGSSEIHRLSNWTDGCVALDNQQIQELDRWIVPGMTVVIK